MRPGYTSKIRETLQNCCPLHVGGDTVHLALKRSWPFPLIIGGGIVGYVYWPTAVGFAATMLSLFLFLPLALVSLGDVLRANKGQPQPTFFEMNLPPPRPLFTGRIANALDSVAHTASGLFGLALLLVGLGLLGYNLVMVAIALASRSAWLSLSAVALAALTVGFYLWRSSVTTRLTTITVLSVLSLATSPVIERVLH